LDQKIRFFLIYFLICASALQLFSTSFASAESVNDLLYNAESADPAVRKKAILKVVELGPLVPDSEQLLISISSDKDEGIRILSAKGLGKLIKPSPAAVSVLVKLLKDESEKVRIESIHSIGRHSDVAFDAIVPLSELLDHGSKQEKLNSLAALRNFGKPSQSVVPTISKRLSDRDWLVRSFALEALLAIGGENSQASIEQAIKNSDAEMLSSAVVSFRAHENVDALLSGVYETLKRNLIILVSVLLFVAAALLWLVKKFLPG